MLGRVTHALAVFVALPTFVLASCHLVGGTNDLVIDENFHTQGTGGSSATGGGAGNGGTPATTTTGGSGGTIELCDPTQCEGEDTDCRDIVCVNNTCGATNVATLTPCAQDGGNFCDGIGACVECINDIDTPCPSGGACQSFECYAASCGDTTQNGDETDVNCGGSCGPCSVGQGCLLNGDCTSAMCQGMVCVSCSSVGCSSGEWCDGGTGRCEDLKLPFDGCGADGECLSDCCVLNTCTVTHGPCE